MKPVFTPDVLWKLAGEFLFATIGTDFFEIRIDAALSIDLPVQFRSRLASIILAFIATPLFPPDLHTTICTVPFPDLLPVARLDCGEAGRTDTSGNPAG